MNKNYLYCYKMTYDTGFAPNPEHNVLTLATCKPSIRRCASPGTWISGCTAIKVHPTEVGEPIVFDENEKLIYLAKISKSIPFAEYWKEYKEKRPKKSAQGALVPPKDVAAINTIATYMIVGTTFMSRSKAKKMSLYNMKMVEATGRMQWNMT